MPEIVLKPAVLIFIVGKQEFCEKLCRGLEILWISECGHWRKKTRETIRRTVGMVVVQRGCARSKAEGFTLKPFSVVPSLDRPLDAKDPSER